MKIDISNNTESAAWDAYVRGHPRAVPYHLQAWTRAIEEAYGHRSFLLAARNHEHIVGILPLVSMRRPIVKSSRLISLPYCDLGGSLGDSAWVEDRLVGAACELAADLGAKSIELRESDCRTAVGKDEACAGKKYRMLLNLPGTSQALWDGFPSKLRSQIRKAEKNGLEFSIGRGQSYVEDFYRVFAENMRKLGSPVHSRRLFEAIDRNFGSNMLISLVRKNDRVVGAGLVLLLDRLAVMPWASTLPQYNRLAPNMLLYWSLLERVTELGCDAFDFGRSTFGEGTYRFKLQWGTRPVGLAWRRLGYDGEELVIPTDSSRLRPLVQQAWCRMPLPLANLAGPLVRKHISL